MIRKLLILLTLLAVSVGAKELRVSHISGGTDDDGEIIDRGSGLIALKTNTLAATADSSAVIYVSEKVRCEKATDAIGFVWLQAKTDTGAIANDTCKFYLYTSYDADTASLKFLLDSALFTAAGTDGIAFNNDTLLKEWLWYEIELTSTENLATDSTNLDQTATYKIRMALITRP